MPLPFHAPVLPALLACLAPAGPAQEPAASPSLPLPQVAEAGPKGARALNLFSEDGKVVKELQPGELVVVREQQGRDWYRVEIPGGFPCYIHSDFTAEGEKPGTLVTTGSGINLRPLPSSAPDAYPIAQVGKGVVLRLLEARSDKWNRVLSPPDATAWASAASLKILGPPEGLRARLDAAAAAAETEWKSIAERLGKERQTREQEKAASDVLSKGDRILTGLAAKWSPEGAAEARAAFEEAAKKSDVEGTKTAVKDRLTRLEALEALEREKEEARKLAQRQEELQRRQADEITRRAEQGRAAIDAGAPPPDIRKRFEAIGWVERTAAAPAVPEFRLAKGGIASYVLTCPSGRYDLVSFLGKEVGIKGKVLENEGRVPRMLVVERLEILSN